MIERMSSEYSRQSIMFEKYKKDLNKRIYELQQSRDQFSEKYEKVLRSMNVSGI